MISPTVIIEVKDGNVQFIGVSDKAIRVHIIDYDNIEQIDDEQVLRGQYARRSDVQHLINPANFLAESLRDATITLRRHADKDDS